MSFLPGNGLSPARLSALDRTVQEKYIDSGAMPGASIQVWRRGELAHKSLLGSMDLERGKPMRDDTIFRIHSMTKPITAVALLMMVEEGKISLGDEVATLIPSWKDLGVLVGGTAGSFTTTPPKRPMRVIDLATHTSGLIYADFGSEALGAAYRALGVEDNETEGGLDTMVDQLAGLPLDSSPGERFNYSVSTTILGYLVQKVSGQSFGEFLRSRLFEPLAMTDTDFWCPPAKLDRFASCYVAYDGSSLTLQDDALTSSYAKPPRLESGGGGLVSTATDYMRFCRMLLNGGSLDGRQVLSPKSVSLLGTNFLPGNRSLPAMGSFAEWEGAGMSICCGTTINMAERLAHGTVGDFFWSGAAATHFWVDPAEDLAVVFLTQVLETPHFFTMQKVLRALVYGAFAGP